MEKHEIQALCGAGFCFDTKEDFDLAIEMAQRVAAHWEKRVYDFCREHGFNPKPGDEGELNRKMKDPIYCLGLMVAGIDEVAREEEALLVRQTWEKRRENQPEIVCLCGSTRFREYFEKANYELTMAGKIVLSVGFYWQSGHVVHGETLGCTPEQKKGLDELHFRKIDLCDRVYVLNVGGYIGWSTRNEISYAEKIGKPVDYLEPLHTSSKGGQ